MSEHVISGKVAFLLYKIEPQTSEYSAGNNLGIFIRGGERVGPDSPSTPLELGEISEAGLGDPHGERSPLSARSPASPCRSRTAHQSNQDSVARHLLSEVYSGFTEGWETRDLREARVLLETWHRQLSD